VSLASNTNPRQRPSPTPLPGTPSTQRHSPLASQRSQTASFATLLAEKQTLSPPPNTLNLLDSWKHLNMSGGIRPASSHSNVSRSSLRIRIVEDDAFNENDDFNPPIISSRFPFPRTKRGRFSMSNTSPHSCRSRRVHVWELLSLLIEQENSFHWLRQGEPMSHSEYTESDTRIGLRGFEGRLDENLSPWFEPEKYRAASSSAP